MTQKQHARLWLFLKVVIAVGLISWGSWSLYQSFKPKDTAREAKQVSAAGEPTKKTDEEKAAYSVPADHPRQLIIPSLAIDANILPMGVTKENTIEAPTSAWDAGWYNKSALPGIATGAMIIDGHVNDTLDGAGIFYSISRLVAGDGITVEKGDMSRLNYRVTGVEQLPLDQVDVDNLIRSPLGGLHLITCGGQYDESQKTYDDRVIVTAVRV
jgi:hypothetical protein